MTTPLPTPCPYCGHYVDHTTACQVRTTTTPLPTCWRCLTCGDIETFDFSHPPHLGPGHYVQAWDGRDNHCGGTPEPCTMVPPTASVEEILSLLPDHDVREALVSEGGRFVCFREKGNEPKKWTPALVVSPRRDASKERLT